MKTTVSKSEYKELLEDKIDNCVSVLRECKTDYFIGKFCGLFESYKTFFPNDHRYDEFCESL